jgi:hypothetical protein
LLFGKHSRLPDFDPDPSSVDGSVNGSKQQRNLSTPKKVFLVDNPVADFVKLFSGVNYFGRMASCKLGRMSAYHRTRNKQEQSL